MITVTSQERALIKRFIALVDFDPEIKLNRALILKAFDVLVEKLKQIGSSDALIYEVIQRRYSFSWQSEKAKGDEYQSEFQKLNQSGIGHDQVVRKLGEYVQSYYHFLWASTRWSIQQYVLRETPR